MITERHTREQILDLALIGNSCAAALVDRNARTVWWCFPYFDSDPAFSRPLAGMKSRDFPTLRSPGSPRRNRAISQYGDYRDGPADANRSPACRASPPSDSSPRTFHRDTSEVWGNLLHSYPLAGIIKLRRVCWEDAWAHVSS